MDTYKDKTAIVTGGASGVGRELCLQLAAKGATVIIADINEDKSISTVAEITGAGGTACAMVCDVRDADAVEKLVRTAASRGHIDLFINNAGVIMFGEFRDMTLADWQHFIDSDLKSVIYGTRFAYEVMIKQGFGSIVNVSSVFGLWPFALATGYSAVKQAVVGLSLALRPEAAGLGVNVSVACPGSIDTDVRKSYKICNGDRDKFNSFIYKQISPKKAAEKILKGAAKNKGVIAFPFYDLIFWWLFRINPALNFLWQKKVVRMFRKDIRHAEMQ
jgi:NAD(P)-dependent dehydrogenase (short-subunit alcohol dehydrogenase family)